MNKQTLYTILVFVSFRTITIQAENLSKNSIAKFLPKNPIVVDAGAFDGTDTQEMSRLWPEGMIYAFEPVPHIFKRLIANTQSCKNVICMQKALSDEVGEVSMFISYGGDQSSSLLQPVEHLTYFPHITFQNNIMVETTTLDRWAEEMGIDHIDLLWFDLQGVEPMVLKASPKIFRTVKVVYTEVSYTNLYKDAPLFDEFKAWMEEQGFVVVKKIMHHSTFGDVLFVRKELVQN